MPSYKVRSDGKDLTFTPGKNGSLTYYQEPSKTFDGLSELDNPRPKTAKVIVSPEVMKKRKSIAIALGSTRG